MKKTNKTYQLDFSKCLRPRVKPEFSPKDFTGQILYSQVV